MDIEELKKLIKNLKKGETKFPELISFSGSKYNNPISLSESDFYREDAFDIKKPNDPNDLLEKK